MVLAADERGVGMAPVEHEVQIASLQLMVCSSPQADHNSPPSSVHIQISRLGKNRPLSCTLATQGENERPRTNPHSRQPCAETRASASAKEHQRFAAPKPSGQMPQSLWMTLLLILLNKTRGALFGRLPRRLRIRSGWWSDRACVWCRRNISLTGILTVTAFCPDSDLFGSISGLVLLRFQRIRRFGQLIPINDAMRLGRLS